MGRDSTSGIRTWTEALSPWVAYGGGTAPLFVLASHFWPFTVDDTFITLRYARNVASGVGLVWNEGESPAEGYTSLLWTLLTAPPHWFTSDAVRVAKLGSFMATIGTLAATAGLVSELTRDVERRPARVARWASVALLGIHTDTAVHAVSAMDTALFAFLLTAFFLASARALARPNLARLRQFVGAGWLVAWTRPEGNLAVLCAGLAVWTMLPRARRGAFVRTGLALYVVPQFVYHGWRLATYGLAFPLPFYVKATRQTHLLAGLEEGWAFVHDVTIASPLFGLAWVVGLLTCPRALRPAAFAAAALFVFFLKPAPLMAYNHRYLFPLLPLLVACASLGILRLAHVLARGPTRWLATETRTSAVVAMLVLATALGTTLHGLPGHLGEKLSYARGLRAAHMELGERLKRERSGSSRRIALLDVGAVAYLSGWNVLDTFGLNEPEIARRGRNDPEYVVAQEPDLLVVISRNARRFEAVFDYEELLHALATDRGYEPCATLEFDPEYHLYVLTRPGYRPPL